MSCIKAALTLACSVQLAMPMLHAESGPTFIPDTTFSGSTLNDWHTIGSASWNATGGEITARGGEGWLVLNRPYQDSAFYASFRCTGVCNTGILMRMEKRDAGSTGAMLAIEGDALVPYRVMIDAAGKILRQDQASRQRSRTGFATRRLLLHRERLVLHVRPRPLLQVWPGFPIHRLE